jgi:hypothetical protein
LVRCEPPRNTGAPSYPVWSISCVTLSPPMPAQLRRHRSNFVELSASLPSPPSSICKLIRSSRRPPGAPAAESRRSSARGMARAGSSRAQTADLAGSAAELRRDTLKLGRGELRGDRLDRARQYRRRVSRALGGLSDPGSKAALKREADRRFDERNDCGGFFGFIWISSASPKITSDSEAFSNPRSGPDLWRIGRRP